MHHEGSIVSAECFKYDPCDDLGLDLRQCRSNRDPSSLYKRCTLLKVYDGMVEDACEEEVEKDWSQDTSLLYTIGDVEWLRRLPTRKY